MSVSSNNSTTSGRFFGGMKRKFKKSASMRKTVRKSFQKKFRKSFDKMGISSSKKEVGDGPSFDMEGAMLVGGNKDLPHIAIEIYDMDYGKRGDFMGEARISPSRFFQEVESGKSCSYMLPLMVRLGTDLEKINKKELKLIQGYVDIKMEFEHIDVERLRLEAELREIERLKDPVQHMLDDPDVKNGVIGICVFPDIEEEEKIKTAERIERQRIANELEAQRLEDERAREKSERDLMTIDDERAREWAELYYMNVEDEESTFYEQNKKAHDDANTWSYVWDDVEMKHYHYNEVTGFMCWETPDALNKEYWKPRWRRDEGVYYYDNIVTQQKDWPAPPSAPPPPPRVFAEIVGGDEGEDGEETKMTEEEQIDNLGATKVWRVPKYNYESEFSTTEEGSWGLIENGEMGDDDGESASYYTEEGTSSYTGQDHDSQYFDDDYSYRSGGSYE